MYFIELTNDDCMVQSPMPDEVTVIEDEATPSQIGKIYVHHKLNP